MNKEEPNFNITGEKVLTASLCLKLQIKVEKKIRKITRQTSLRAHDFPRNLAGN